MWPGPTRRASWLAASVGRTTLFADCLGLALVAWWCVMGIAVALGPPGAPDHLVAARVAPGVAGDDAGGHASDDAGDKAGDYAGDNAGENVDAGGPVVLHPGP